MTSEIVNTSKKPRESDRRRRRRKQKKNKSNAVALNAKQNSDHPQQVLEDVEVVYIPEKAELDGFLDDEFRKVFEKFTFKETAALEENDQKEEAAANAALNKKASSDSEEEDQDTRVKDKGGISNKKKKLERRMKIAELKQISARPDVVEVR
ncbi:hypothetical protein CTI12_AA604730 [Artemisia annua]|uniref:Uncharacterized protein n=1 Tax=Artemisia annua TaxID=35608 RepID=A0A2U1KH51_ARTAN|nr:hypothetical protein CTI12_AA604730 [Artemisia annua]